MNILRIVYDWPNPWQGLAPHPYEITAAQLKQGHKVTLFCGQWTNSGGPIKLDGLEINAINREPYPNTIFFTSSVVLFFRYLKYRKTNKPDVIHCHGHFAVWLYAYRVFLKRHLPWSQELKIPLVVHFHNTAKGRWETFIKQGKPIKTMSSVSADNVKEAQEYYGANPAKCFLIETGVNTEMFVPVGEEEKEKSRKEIGFDRFDKVILNHGVMNERKNIHLLIDALALLPEDYKLLLSGTGDPTYLEKLNEQMKLKKVEHRVIKTGYTPYPHVPIAYQVSDIFVLPSSWEGLPKAVMQGLSCGIPCLVSGFKISEDIRGVFYLENLEPQTIANKILEITGTPRDVDVQLIRSKHSWNTKIEGIDGIYDFAIKNYI
ncbi:MAG: Glycosyl transferase group 1 [candidate division WWE3 bacterium GW2011_GWB1_42_41]|nr:MAG: Glycosyl transferase group 1 [candidate division WWE3 bacterium GW2011_GWB1_42_41]